MLESNWTCATVGDETDTWITTVYSLIVFQHVVVSLLAQKLKFSRQVEHRLTGIAILLTPINLWIARQVLPQYYAREFHYAVGPAIALLPACFAIWAIDISKPIHTSAVSIAFIAGFIGAVLYYQHIGLHCLP